MSCVACNHVHSRAPGRSELIAAAVLRVSFHGQLVSEQDFGHQLSGVFTVKTSSRPGPLGRRVAVAFSGRRVRQLPCSARASSLMRSRRPFGLLALFFSPRWSCLLLSPLGGCQGPHRPVLLTRLEGAVGLLFGSVSGSTGRACLKPGRWWVPAACRSQPINLPRHPARCHLTALFTRGSPWKQTLQSEGSPPTPRLGRDLKRLTFPDFREVPVTTPAVLEFQFPCFSFMLPVFGLLLWKGVPMHGYRFLKNNL